MDIQWDSEVLMQELLGRRPRQRARGRLMDVVKEDMGPEDGEMEEDDQI